MDVWAAELSRCRYQLSAAQGVVVMHMACRIRVVRAACGLAWLVSKEEVSAGRRQRARCVAKGAIRRDIWAVIGNRIRDGCRRKKDGLREEEKVSKVSRGPSVVVFLRALSRGRVFGAEPDWAVPWLNGAWLQSMVAGLLLLR